MPRRATFAAVWIIAVIFGLARPASAETASADTMAAARELVETMRAGDQLKTLLPLMMQQLKPAIVQGRPDVEKDYDALVPQLLAAANERMKEFVDAVATVYAAHFTADELRQLTSFYHGAVGQKFLQNMPVIMKDSLSVGQKFGQSLASDLRGRMIDELRKRGHDI
jgi:hypothetical protein